MSLTVEQQTRLIDHFFDTLHPEICKDDHNLKLISNFIREKTAGLDKLNIAAFDWAIADLSGQLHYYANVDVSQRLAAGAEAAKQLAEAEREKQKRGAALLRLQTLEQSQRNRTPGTASAFSGREEIAKQEERDRKAAQDAATRAMEHAAMLAELQAIESYLATNVHGILYGKTAEVKSQRKAALRLKFPCFKHEIV